MNHRTRKFAWGRLRLGTAAGLLHVLAACGAGDDHGARVEPPDTAASSDVETETGILEGSTEFLPSDLIAWVESQPDPPWALVRVLDAIAGVAPAPDPFSRQVLAHGARVLVPRAREVLATGDLVADLRQSLEGAVGRLAPSSDRLNRYSSPASVPLLRIRPASTAQAQDVACREIWHAGFPEESAGANAPTCYLHGSWRGDSGAEYEVYVPASLRDDEELHEYLDALAEVFARSDRRLRSLAQLPDVRLVFTLLPSTGEHSDALASVPNAERNYCPISVFPGARQDQSRDQFKQIVAHELVHCLQDADFDYSGHREDAWLIEGGAEYLSDIIYPTIDVEYRLLPALNSMISAGTPILDTGYAAWPWFSWLQGVKGSAEAVWETMAIVNASGDRDAQTRELLANNAEVWMYNFGISYVDSQLQDAGGKSLPVAYHPERAFLQPNDQVRIDAKAFTFKMVAVTVSRCVDVAIGISQSGSSKGAWGLRRAGGRHGSWETPGLITIPASAEEETYEVMVAGVGGEPWQTYGVTFDASGVVAVGDVECPDRSELPVSSTEDPCYVGSWSLVADSSFSGEGLGELLGRAESGGLQYVGSTGGARLMLEADGRAKYLIDSLALSFFSHSMSIGTIRTTVRLDGEANATYAVRTGTGATGIMDFMPVPSAPSNVQAVVGVEVQGESVESPMNLSDVFSEAAQGDARYDCVGNVMTLAISGPGESTPLYRNARYVRAR